MQVQLRVIGALTLRELGTRFGRDNLGYLWLFLEPALLGGSIGLIHHLIGHGLPGGLDVVTFWVIGYIPYYLLRGVVNRAPSAIVANQSLLYHRQVTLPDIIIARNLLEGAATFGAMVAFLLLFGVVTEEWPRDPALLVLGMGLMLGLAHGLALLIAVGSVYTELFERMVHLVTYLALPVTGAFFMVFWLPTELQRAALWIPTVHLFEMVRAGQYGAQVPTHYDMAYVAGWVACLNLLGMAGLRRARRDLVV
ncbi:ABC transporter permease [Siccirubricoccus sp. G192]|uniref:ABC transporter permease n=1 Tax=Siccirubricoccus sp. G192 TaxID=2849651 RepID=UPI001C2BA856|nr:ABC transporter permease [Siccirubricoccus sp. G192]MBV1799602.1 ABC transporter permease [Siccirubricoccus sp. G192]